jgi:hypothetical protein
MVEEREHVTTGLDCWCNPRVDCYGAEDSDKQQIPPEPDEES